MRSGLKIPKVSVTFLEKVGIGDTCGDNSPFLRAPPPTASYKGVGHISQFLS